ncbi:MAG: GNAT family N-acetyltransferase [Hyphomicrobium sp.]
MKTPRLILRSLTDDDAPRIAALAGEWSVASMTGRIPYPYSVEAAHQWVSGLAAGEMVFGIEHAGELIGICGYTLENDGSAQIGYWIGKPYWGRGFATEAVRALLNFGFTKGGVKRFNGRHFTDNLASARVITKLGFRAVGADVGWCEARQQEFPTVAYERRRPWTTAIKALAS